MSNEQTDTNRKPPILAMLLPVFLILFLGFIITTASSPEPDQKTGALNPEWYRLTTARGELLQYKPLVGNCFICHMSLIPDPTVRIPRFVHQKVILEHGSNDRCYNCHLIHDRNYYAADDGSKIMPTNPEKLCARCHGLIHKDWQAGTHGLMRGEWSGSVEFKRERTGCTHCHDPHAPNFRFDKFAPPPSWPPNTVRQLAQSSN